MTVRTKRRVGAAMLTNCSVAVLALAAGPAPTDTIYRTKGGEVFQAQCIVLDTKPLTFQYFGEHVPIVFEVATNLPDSFVVVATDEERRAMVDGWKERGFTTEVVDTSGHGTTFFTTHVHWVLPSGHRYLISGGGAKQRVDFVLDVGGEKLRENQVELTLVDGKNLRGTIAPLEVDHVGLEPVLKGISGFEGGRAKVLQAPLSALREITFIPR
jgi:hypothetical protein